MAVDAVSAAQGQIGSSRTRLADNFETFLTLLTAQLKNQDPLSPMDSTQFTQQLTQMTGVEQQLLTNELLEKLVSASSGGVGDAVALIGKQVRAVSDEATLSGGTAAWVYRLDRAADDVKLEVLDDNGKVVRTLAGDKAAGEHALAWDGKDAAGRTLPDGTFSLRVTARDSTGATVPSTTFVEGVVRSVEQVDGVTLISVGATRLPWTTVSAIAEAPANPAPQSQQQAPAA